MGTYKVTWPAKSRSSGNGFRFDMYTVTFREIGVRNIRDMEVCEIHGKLG